MGGKRPASPSKVLTCHFAGWQSPLRRVGRRRMQNPRSPGDMRASFSFETQISGQTDGRPRVGAKKASNKVVKIWPPRVLAYAGSCKHCLPFRLSRLVRCTPKPDHVPDSNTARACQLPSTVRSIFFIYFRRVQTFWPTRARAEKARNERREIN